MDTERTGSFEPGTYPARNTDQLVGDTVYTAPVRSALTPTSGIHTGENLMPVRNRVQWGPIFGGVVSAIVAMVLLTVLGVAVGASVLDRTASGDEVGSWAAIWGAVSAIVSFFIGGWVAAKTAAVGGSFAGLMNGLMVGAAGLLLIIYLTSSGVGNLFGTVSSNLGDILNATATAANVAQDEGVDPADLPAPPSGEEIQAQAQETARGAEQAVRSSVDEIRTGAFAAFLGLLLPLIAAALGGFLGYNKREELIHGTGGA